MGISNPLHLEGTDLGSKKALHPRRIQHFARDLGTAVLAQALDLRACAVRCGILAFYLEAVHLFGPRGGVSLGWGEGFGFEFASLLVEKGGGSGSFVLVEGSG